MKVYIGVAKCCGRITAVMTDENSSPKDVARFANIMHKLNRELRHAEFEPGQLKMERCRCDKKPAAEST